MMLIAVPAGGERTYIFIELNAEFKAELVKFLGR